MYVSMNFAKITISAVSMGDAKGQNIFWSVQIVFNAGQLFGEDGLFLFVLLVSICF